MKREIEHLEPEAKAAFTLLELIVAIVILVVSMSIAFEAFSSTIRGWKRGMEVAEGITHGDFAMQPLVCALDSTIYFYNQRKCYAFKIENGTKSGYPADLISFVTASGAFMPADSPYAKGPHRLKLYIDTDNHGDPALFAIPMPAIADDEEFEDEFDVVPILVSHSVCGLDIQFWDSENEDWTEEWEEENSVPERVQVTLVVAAEDENDEPIEFTRVIEIPVFDSVKERLSSPTITKASSGSAPARRTNNQSVPTQGGNLPAPSGLSAIEP